MLRRVAHGLLDDLGLRHGLIMTRLLGLLIHVGRRLVHALGGRHGRRHLVRHGLRHGWMALIVMLRRWVRGILERFGLQVKGLRTVVVLVIADCRRHTVKLQTNASSTGPCIRCCRVALDFASTTSFACSHYCCALASACQDKMCLHTFQSFVSIVFVYEYIIWRCCQLSCPQDAERRVDSLRWFSRGASVGGAKVKLCICAVCGSSGRPVVSGGITLIATTSRSGVTAQGLAQWLQAAGLSAIH